MKAMPNPLHPDTGRSRTVGDDWLESKRAHAGPFLFTVAGLTLWAAGFIDLVTHTSNPPTVFGRFSVPYALFVCAYALGFVVWITLLRRDGAELLDRAVRAVQQRWWLGVLIFVACAGLVASMFLVKNWANLPLFELAMLALGLIIVGTVLLARPRPGGRMQPWRKVLVGGVAAWVAIEGACQLATLAGVLPFSNMSGAFTAYGRIYHNREGLANGLTNRYGWYYPEADANARGSTVILTGDTFVQGLQVRPEQNVGLVLQTLMRRDGPANGPANVVSLGFPGYTAALYTDPKLAPYTMLQFNPSEVVVFFHLANDLQATDAPTGQYPFYTLDTLDASGGLVRREEDAGVRHALQHLIIRAYDPVNPVQSLQSHLFTVQALRKLIGYKYVYHEYGDLGVPPVAALNTDFASDAQPFGRSTFAFEPKGNAQTTSALGIARAQLRELKQQLDELGIGMRLVTIPYFPRAFFGQNGTGWSARVGEHDALLPEAALGEVAAALDIPYLPMGEYMQRKGTTVGEIESLYFNRGAGHFTAEGHRFFAQATHACFYGGGACPVP